MKRLLTVLANSIKEQRIEILLYILSISSILYIGPYILHNFSSIGDMSYGPSGRFGSGYSGGSSLLAGLLSAAGVIYFTYTIPKDIISSIKKQLHEPQIKTKIKD
jgi:hypothetical protein